MNYLEIILLIAMTFGVVVVGCAIIVIIKLWLSSKRPSQQQIIASKSGPEADPTERV